MTSPPTTGLAHLKTTRCPFSKALSMSKIAAERSRFSSIRALLSREIADELAKSGIKIEKEGGMQIKVANGDKSAINEIVRIPIKLGGQWTDSMKFFILKNLPFDVLIGNPALDELDAELSWKTRLFSIRPRKARDGRIQVNWKNFAGQHWRKPIALAASETIILEPFSETAVPVKGGDGEWDGVFGECGLITPNRSKQVIDSKFSTAYGFAGESGLTRLLSPTQPEGK